MSVDTLDLTTQQKTRFEGTVQQEIFSDYFKRENDWRVRQNVIVPFAQNQQLKQLNMLTLPCTAPIWEMELRAEPLIKHVEMNATLVECDRTKHRMLQEALHKNCVGMLVDNLRASRGGTQNEYVINFEPLAPTTFQKAIKVYGSTVSSTPLHLMYADFCGCWSDQHLALFDAVSNSPYLADEFLLGITVDLKTRVETAEACREVRRQIHAVNTSQIADGVVPFFSSNTADPQGKEILTGVCKASHLAHKLLKPFNVKLEYAGVYRRAASHNKKTQMGTLWYHCEKK